MKFNNYRWLKDVSLKIITIDNYGNLEFLNQLPVEEVTLKGNEIRDLRPLLALTLQFLRDWHD